MKKLLGMAALSAFLALPFFIQAADQPAEAPKPEKKASGMPFRGAVTAVDKAAKTITLGEKEKARVFQITSQTKIRKDKKPATLEDVLVGERVGGYARENTQGKMEVVTLNAGLPPKKPKAKPGDNKPAI